MAKYVLQELPEGMSNGKKVLYPRMQTYSMHDFETVLKNMHVYAGSLSSGIMRGVVDALVQTMKTWMPLGHTIKIDGLGVFSLSLGFDTSTASEQAIAKGKKKKDGGKEKDEKTKYRHVCIQGINFKPDPELLKSLNEEATFERADTDVKTSKCTLSRNERIAAANTIIGKNGYLTLTDYVNATGLSRTAASRELKDLTADPSSGITTRGNHSHKVWVKGE
jgi:predicted histone-like DNA-binding protein